MTNRFSIFQFGRVSLHHVERIHSITYSQLHPNINNATDNDKTHVEGSETFL